ncbi:MAG TPA: PAS domain S-box protein [bacterium]|nr:PAS domain S-box protein [bacterium]
MEIYATTTEQLKEEIGELRQQIIELEKEKTERRKAEETLRENQRQLFLATQIAQLGFWDLNLANGDLYWSDETYRHYGYKPQEFVPSYEKFRSIVHPDDMGFVQERVDAALNNDAEYNIDFRFIKLDGSIGYIHTQGMVISRDETDKALRFIGTQIDITGRKEEEEERKTFIRYLGVRVKELRCLYGITGAIQKLKTVETIFRDVVELIPPGWQYPEITRCRILFDGQEYVTEPFDETEWKQTSDIVINGKRRGSVEVYYLEERPELDEGPFQLEERNLIDGIASTLSNVQIKEE